MVDLITQYQKIKPQVDMAIESILEKAQFINGPDVHAFKDEMSEYLGAKHVIPCANGTDALQMDTMTQHQSLECSYSQCVSCCILNRLFHLIQS